MQLNDQNVWLITGCSTGIGRAIVEALIAEGALVSATARDRDAVRDLELSCPERVLSLELDVADNASVQAAVSKTLQRFGKIDVLVNNAGRSLVGAIEETSDAETRALFETNLFGTLNVIRAVLPGMRMRRSGHIVTLGSAVGFAASPGVGIYCASKFAIEGAHEALVGELRPLGIAVTLLEPGLVKTEMRGSMRDNLATAIDDYGDTAGRVRAGIVNEYPEGTTEPAAIARAVLNLIIHLKEKPFRIQLGEDAVNMVESKLAAVGADLAKWRKFSVQVGGKGGAASVYANLANNATDP